MQKINFENKPSTVSPINATNLNALQDNVEDAIDEVQTNVDNKQLNWVQVDWTGDETGGTITTNVDLRYKLVCFEFTPSANQYHRIPVTFYVSYSNSYSGGHYGVYDFNCSISGISNSGFNLIITPKSGSLSYSLNKIFYLDL